MSLALESDVDLDLHEIRNTTGSSLPMLCFRQGSPPLPDVYNTSLTGLGHIRQSIFLIASNAAAILPAYWSLRNKFLDFWLSFMAVVSTFVYLSTISEPSKRAIHTVVAILTALMAETGPTRSSNIALVIAIGALGLLVGLLIELCTRYRSFFFSTEFNINLLHGTFSLGIRSRWFHRISNGCDKLENGEHGKLLDLAQYPRGSEEHDSLTSHDGIATVRASALLIDLNLNMSTPDTYRPPPAPLPYDVVFGRPESTDPESGQVISAHTLEKPSCIVLKEASCLKESDILPVSPKKVDLQFLKSEPITVSTDEDDTCPTCLEEYNKENPKILTKCSHHFHLSCILEWKERSNTCPICDQVRHYYYTFCIPKLRHVMPHNLGCLPSRN
ncbi:protein binding protein [Dorcoceras hygrometricum]|uniref:RING-type E3 ubiquitin transferase n=1 Tax=Dorcoceras hygrometricum TaxID=472368 RepID=A0A2Z7AJ61_9LAMI|nr:protein binding protein [Dorcoceras hygrometricum]